MGASSLWVLLGLVLAIVGLPGLIWYLTKYNLWLRGSVVLTITWQLTLLGVLIFHSIRVGWFDFDWADDHLMGLAGIGATPLAIGVMADVASPEQSKPAS